MVSLRGGRILLTKQNELYLLNKIIFFICTEIILYWPKLCRIHVRDTCFSSSAINTWIQTNPKLWVKKKPRKISAGGDLLGPCKATTRNWNNRKCPFAENFGAHFPNNLATINYHKIQKDESYSPGFYNFFVRQFMLLCLFGLSIDK